MRRAYKKITASGILGISLLAMGQAMAKDCIQNCIPQTPPQCGKDVAGRHCGPLRDRSYVEQKQTIAPNLEKGSEGGAQSQTGFDVYIDGVGSNSVANLQRQGDIKANNAQSAIQFDTLKADPILSVITSRPAYAMGDAVQFFSYSNYSYYTPKAEVIVYKDDQYKDKTPYVTLPVELGKAALWTPNSGDLGDYVYVLRVYAHDNSHSDNLYDETAPQTIRVSNIIEKADTEVRTGPIFTNLRQRSAIPVNGVSVTISGNLPAGAKDVRLYNSVAQIGADGRYFAQQIVPGDIKNVAYKIIHKDGSFEAIERPVQVPKSDRFMVAIADVTAGHNSTNNQAAIEALQGERADEINKDFLSGRLAFYYKNRIKNRYNITASADTGEHPLGDLFSQFGKKDSQSLLRRLDPDSHYPVYGDDSITVEDAPTYGRFYLRVDDDTKEFIWGNFQTSLSGTELVQYSRGLYGAGFRWHSPELIKNGEKKSEINAFAADPGTIGAREEYNSTGGSVYYLRHTDIVQGSERVFAEVRDKVSGIVLERKELVPSQDYDTNYIQGRILLRTPLSITADSTSFVSDGMLSGDPIYLIATYEYSPGLTEVDATTMGLRGRTWVNDNVSVGATAYHQGGDQTKLDLYGADVTIRKTENTYVKLEVAHSSGDGAEISTSSTGGVGFNSITSSGGNANAYSVDAAIDLNDISKKDGSVKIHWRNRDAGFSGPGSLTQTTASEQLGILANLKLSTRTGLFIKHDLSDANERKMQATEIGISHDFSSKYYGKIGVRDDDRSGDGVTASNYLNEKGERLDGAVTLGYNDVKIHPDGTKTQPWGVYVFGQYTLDKDEGRSNNDRYGFGGHMQIGRRTKISGEVSDGDMGTGAKFGLDYAYSENGNIAVNYALAAEDPDSYVTGRLGRLTTTIRNRFNSLLTAYAEARYDNGTGPTGLTQAYGIDFNPTEAWQFGLKTEAANITDAVNGDIVRHAFSGTAAYSKTNWRMNSAIEYREDDYSGGNDSQTWAMRSNLTVKPDNNWRLFAKFNLARTYGNNESAYDANYTEAVLAGAYRPVNNDRFNMLAKLTYLRDIPSNGQLSASGVTSDYAQRSLVFAIDGTYQLTDILALGGKIALKRSEIRASKDSSAAWQGLDAQFYAIRADIRIIKEWDALVEGRILKIDDAEDMRAGMLIGVYRHFGDRLKLGAGYNFTNYSDDLTDLSYKEKGAFINMIAKY